PQPPVPVSVSSRVVARSRVTSAISRSRPTKLVRLAGRLWGVLRILLATAASRTGFRPTFGGDGGASSARPAVGGVVTGKLDSRTGHRTDPLLQCAGKLLRLMRRAASWRVQEVGCASLACWNGESSS